MHEKILCARLSCKNSRLWRVFVWDGFARIAAAYRVFVCEMVKLNEEFL